MSARAIRLWTSAALLAAALLALPSAAEAAYPGLNGKIAYASGGVFTMNPDGTAPTRLTTAGGQPVWSPDGRRIAYAITGATACQCQEIRVMDADGTDDVVIFEGASSNAGGSPTWSPDGERLAIASAGDIWTMDADGSGAAPVMLTPETEGSPAWSPNGREIAFETNPGIDAVRPDGSGRRTIVPPPADPYEYLRPWVSQPDWSPAGDRLVYRRLEECDGYRTAGLLMTVRSDGTGTTRIAGSCYGAYNDPSWSPDGTRIVAWSYGDGEVFPISTQNAGGGGFHDTGVVGSAPDWQPIPVNAYPRPKVASPIEIALVPAYEPCTSPNRTHGPPLAFGSCNPPVRTPGQLTVGTPDANGKAPRSSSEVHLQVLAGTPSTPGDEADVRLYGTVNDVRLASDLSDYTGTLEARVSLRITDKDNTPSPGGPGAATTADVPYSFPIPCAATADANVGAECNFDTTAEAFVPGIAKEGGRAIWELGQLAVYDGGGGVFMRQGLFVP